MKESLLKCGYDSIENMGMICVESVTDMEQYLKIKFLPAHKDLILYIVDQIEEMEKRKRPQQSKKQKQKKTDSDKPSRNQRKKVDDEKVKCNKSDTSTQAFKIKLVDKIRNYVRSNNLGYENMTNDNVIGLKRCNPDGKYLYECYFKCPYCEKTHSAKCNLTKNWDARNIYKHLNEKHKFKPESRTAGGVSSTESRAPVIQNVYSMFSTAATSSDGCDYK